MVQYESITLLEDLLKFAKSPNQYRGKRCGRFAQGIEIAIKTLETGSLDYAKEQDKEYWNKNQLKIKIKRRTKK